MAIMREKIKKVFHFEKYPVYESLYYCMATVMCTNF